LPSHCTHPRYLEKSGEVVQVSWSGAPPGEVLAVALYSPASSEDADFVGFFNVTMVPGWETGSGSFSTTLTNSRSDVQFRLIRPTKTVEPLATTLDAEVFPFPTASPLAVSNTVNFKNVNEPTGVRLALTSATDAMRVMWNSAEALKDAGVAWGTDASKLDQFALASSKTYTISDMCGAPANQSVGWRDPGYINDAVMTALQPGSQVWYRVGSETHGWSDVQSFFAHPGVGADVETKAFVFGDMGCFAEYTTWLRLQPSSRQTVDWIHRDIMDANGPTMLAHIGDISYARGYGFLWDLFLGQVQQVSAVTPYMVSIGNHEYDYPDQPFKPSWGNYGTDSGGECGVPYNNLFNMPGPVGVNNLWYSVDYGSIHFVFFSTEHDFTAGSPCVLFYGCCRPCADSTSG